MRCQRKRKHIEDFFFIAWFVKENQENYCTSGLRNEIFENKRRMKKIKTMKVRGKTSVLCFDTKLMFAAW